MLHRPDGPPRDGLVLAHGAGGDSRMPLLAAVAEAFVARGLCVLRCDLPFRQKRPHGPPSPSTAAADRAGLKEALAALRTIAPGRLFLGGQSYGGRQASMLAVEEPTLCDALLLLSYPLHPPGKPEQMRTGHFASLRTPTLFVHGPHDPFASSSELGAALALIPAPVSLVEIEGAGHDLLRGKFDAGKLVAEPFFDLVTSRSGRTGEART
jgi:predicted alpha/beta-hydrolase family hydrolase